MKKIVIVFFLFLSFLLISEAKNTQTVDPNQYLQPESFFDKVSKPFKRKKKFTWDKMPTTTQEWTYKAKSIPLNERENPKVEPPVNKKLTKVLPRHAYLVPYNDPSGGYEEDLSDIKHNKTHTSNGVSDAQFKKMAFVKYYFYPSENQITSELFIVPLNPLMPRVKRMTDANILKANKVNNLESSIDNLTSDFFSTLTVIDWSKSGNMIFVKEKFGSLNSGIFRTIVYKILVDDDGEQLSYSKFDFESEIKKYWSKKTDFHLNFYRWDIKPLGISKDDDNLFIVIAFAYDKLNNKIFLGAWGADIKNSSIKLISDKVSQYQIQANGVSLKYELP